MKSIVFVLGAPRSGTSAVRSAIYETRYKGPGEAHTVGLLKSIVDHAIDYAAKAEAAKAGGNLLASITTDLIISSLCNAYVEMINRAHPTDYFIDKTPSLGPIQALELVDRYLPIPVRFLFCKRRGVDNIQSNSRKWPDRVFGERCQEWASIIDLWDITSPKISSPVMEVEFYDLNYRRRETTIRIADFLQVTTAEQQAMANFLEKNSPERTVEMADGIGQPLSATGWTDSEKEQFVSLTGATMKRSGYGLESYWA